MNKSSFISLSAIVNRVVSVLFGLYYSRILNDDTCDHYSYEFSEDFSYTNEICWFQGSLLFIRRDLFKELNGFDDDYFMYCEDVDICYRIKKRGLSLIKNERLSVYHKGGSSEPVRDHDFYRRWYKSRILFMHKHYNDNEFNNFINSFYKRERLLNIRYTILNTIFPNRYKIPALEHQVMFEILKKTIDSSTKYLYYQDFR